MRRKILYLGYHNRITLHYGALLGMTEIMTLLYLHWLRVQPGDPELARARPLRAEQGPRRAGLVRGALDGRLLRRERISTASAAWTASCRATPTG